MITLRKNAARLKADPGGTRRVLKSFRTRHPRTRLDFCKTAFQKPTFEGKLLEWAHPIETYRRIFKV
jgi:hypothetical protein